MACRASVFDYLGQSVSAIFKDNETADVNWSKAGNPFREGYFSVSSDEVEKVKALKKALQVTRGCIDPDAANYNPDATEDDGSCVYVPVDKAKGDNVGQYVGNAINGLFSKMDDINTDMPNYRV